MGGKQTVESRQPTAEEKELLTKQSDAIERAVSIAEREYGLAEADRQYISNIFRGQADPNDPEVKAEFQRILEKTQSDKYESAVVSPERQAELREMFTEEYREGYGVNSKKTRFDEEGYNQALEAEKQSMSKLSEGEQDNIFTSVLESMGSGESVDKLLFDAIKDSKSELGLALKEWTNTTKGLTDSFGQNMSGISDKYADSISTGADTFKIDIKNISDEFATDSAAAVKKYGEYSKEILGKYTDKMGQLSADLGKADKDILSQQTGASLAGISQAYKESRDQALSQLSRRGLAGSGVEAGVTTQLGQAEAMQKAGAYTQAQQQAIGLSDQRRMQQMGIAGQTYGAEQQQGYQDFQNQMGQIGGVASMYSNTAQQTYNASQQAAQGIYSSGMQAAGTVYDANMNLANTGYNLTAANMQQGIGNYAMGSGIASGFYGMSNNLLGQAGATNTNIAGTAGQTATQIGATDSQYQSNIMNANASVTGAMYGAVATGASYGIFKPE